MSSRSYASGGGRESSNKRWQTSRDVEELLPQHRKPSERLERSLVAPLRDQLALEYRLQSLCQRLLDSYKDQKDWAAVGQVAQSLVTNTQRVSLLKERLLSGPVELDDSRSLHLGLRRKIYSEAPARDSQLTLIAEVSDCEEEEGEEGEEEGAVLTETESESEPISLGKAFEGKNRDVFPLHHHHCGRREPRSRGVGGSARDGGDSNSGSSGESGASSAVDYETASQRTSTSSEAEPETSTTGLEDSFETRSALLQPPFSASTTPSPTRRSDSKSIACPSPTPDITKDLPSTSEFPPTNSDSNARVEKTELEDKHSSVPVEEEKEEEEEGGGGGEKKESFTNSEITELVGDGMARETNYVEMHRVKKEEEGVMEEEWNQEGGGEAKEIEGERRSSFDPPRESSSDSFSGEEFPCTDTKGRSQSTSLPRRNGCSTQQPEMLSLPGRPMGVSGSDSKLNLTFTGLHHHNFNNSDQETSDDPPCSPQAVAMEKCSSSDNLDLSLPSNITPVFNRKRQASIPHFVSRQTKGLRKSTRKFVKRMGSISIRRSGRGSLDGGSGLSVTIPTPIRGQDWDPTCLLEELYDDYRRLARSSSLDNARHSGYMDKLPVAQTKKTLLKGYKRRYFRAFEGNLYYYEDRLSERALGFLKLEDCKLVLIPEKVHLCLTQNDGTTLVMRAPNHAELSEWHRALQLESLHPTSVIRGHAIEDNPVIIMDIGACSVRVGLVGENTYPELFFPAVSSVDSSTGECNDTGLEALLPGNRVGAKLVYPRRGTVHMSRNSSIANQAIVDIVDTVLNHYDLESYQCSLIMTFPLTIPEQERDDLAEALLGTVFQFQSILFQEQAVLSLYSYNTTTGIVVDIGDHIDIVPVIDGYTIEGGIHRLPFGGNAITEYLTKLLTAKGIRYFSETETYINRFIKEDACFVSLNYVEDCETCESRPAHYSHQINVDRFQLPDHRKAIVIDDARFKATEGLFTPGLWGKDVTGLHDLVWKAVQACPIDQRKLMLRNIYLSGGTSQLPGLQERLKAEITSLAPSGNTVEVHASENRQHAAFLGAAVLARLSSFSESVVTQDEWNVKGSEALKKWTS